MPFSLQKQIDTLKKLLYRQSVVDALDINSQAKTGDRRGLGKFTWQDVFKVSERESLTVILSFNITLHVWLISDTVITFLFSYQFFFQCLNMLY